MSRRAIFCGVCVLVFLVGNLSGCSKPATDPISKKEFLGHWVEDTSSIKSAGASGGVISGKPQYIRDLIINEDGTYKMVICNGEGKPLDPPQFIEGKWTIRDKEKMVAFDGITRKLDSQYDGWGPFRSIRVGTKARGEDTDFLEMRTEDSTKVRFIRSEKK